jgi:site-specific DNA-adenine methylase
MTKEPNSLASHFGSKGDKRLGRFITSHFPKTDRLIIPCCGLGSYLRHLEPRQFEWLSDIYRPNTNLLMQVRDNLPDLNKKVEEFLKHDRKYFCQKGVTPLNTEHRFDPIEWAAWYFLYCSYSACGGGTKWNTGYRERGKVVNTDHLEWWSNRLKSVLITEAIPNLETGEQHGKADVFSVLQQVADWGKGFVYLDPPYPWWARKSKDKRVKDQVGAMPRRQYAFDWDKPDHERLLKFLVEHPMQIIVSSHPNEFYDEYLSGWQVKDLPYRHGNIERIYISPGVDK